MASTQSEVCLGLDVGGSAIKAVAFRAPGEILARHEIASHAATVGPEGVQAAIQETVAYLKSQGFAFSRIGIGCAGSVDFAHGVVINSPNFAHWSNVPIRDWAQERFLVQVALDNDANCAALAEWKLGRAAGSQHMVLLTLGTGIGGGLVLDGRLYRGASGSAGELGHITIHANGIWCACGNRGCFERYCSASALAEKFPSLSAKEVFERARQEPYLSAVRTFIAELQVGLTSVANAFDPECLVLGGALSDGLLPYFEQIELWVKQHAFPSVGANIRLVHAQHGTWSGAIGAALLTESLSS